jgi:hypothetical protein
MYGKLFAQMYDGTLGTEGPWQALVTFQQFIILADREGVVDMTQEAIARRTTIPPDIIQIGIEALEKPDPHSRSPDEEGRRIIRLSDDRAWGWRVVNYDHYRKIRSQEDRREYMRNYQRKRRATSKDVNNIVNNVSNVNQSIGRGIGRGIYTPSHPDTCAPYVKQNVIDSQSLSTLSAHTEAEAEAEAVVIPSHPDTSARSRFVKPTLDEISAYCTERRNSVNPGLFFDHYESNGWRVGRNPMKDWKAAVRTWEKNQRGRPNGKDARSRAKRVADKLDDIARRDIERNGFTENLD